MLTSYSGACHCRAVRFEIEARIDHVRVCDCSICAMRGGLMFRIPDTALRLLTPLDALTTYRWGSGTAIDYFCPTCGILPFRRPSQPTRAERAAGVAAFDGWAVNTRCLEGFSPDAVPMVAVAGRALVAAPLDADAR